MQREKTGRKRGAAARWMEWTGRCFLALGAIGFAAFFVGLVLSGTVWGATKGCEECTPHITVVLLAFGLLFLSVLCGIIGLALYAASHHLGRPQRPAAVRKARG